MKLSGWIRAVAGCLRERQFWREALRETFYLVTSPSSGLGVAITTAALAIGHRVMHAACPMVSPPATGNIE